MVVVVVLVVVVKHLVKKVLDEAAIATEQMVSNICAGEVYSSEIN